MTVFHAIFSQGKSQRDVWLEIIDVFLHLFSDLGNLWEVLILEEAVDTGHDLVAIFESGVKIGGI